MSARSVIAAIDLGASTGRVLYHASGLARLIQAPLKVLCVNGDTSAAACQQLLDACLRLGPYQADFDAAQIVIRSGRVSDAIAREASHDRAALVVMGLRVSPKCQPGSIAAAMLKTKSAFVLAIPVCRGRS